MGEEGFSGARAVMVASSAAGFKEHPLPAQNALTLLERSVTPRPIFRRRLESILVITPNRILTVVASRHEHDDESAPVKVKSELHGHDGAVIPP